MKSLIVWKQKSIYFAVMNPQVLTLFGENKKVDQDDQPNKIAGSNSSTSKASAKAKKPDNSTSEILADWKADKQYYTIGEVAALFKVNTSHIRFWTKEFDLKVRTTRKGDRLYTPDLIHQLHTIYNLVKERGFTLAGAKAKMKGGVVEPATLKQSLTILRKQLASILTHLSK